MIYISDSLRSGLLCSDIQREVTDYFKANTKINLKYHVIRTTIPQCTIFTSKWSGDVSFPRQLLKNPDIENFSFIQLKPMVAPVIIEVGTALTSGGSSVVGGGAALTAGTVIAVGTMSLAAGFIIGDIIVFYLNPKYSLLFEPVKLTPKIDVEEEEAESEDLDELNNDIDDDAVINVKDMTKFSKQELEKINRQREKEGKERICPIRLIWDQQGCGKTQPFCQWRRDYCVDHSTHCQGVTTYNRMDNSCSYSNYNNKKSVHSELKMWDSILSFSGWIEFVQDQYPCESCRNSLSVKVQRKCATDDTFKGLIIKYKVKSWKKCLRLCCEKGKVPRDTRCNKK